MAKRKSGLGDVILVTIAYAISSIYGFVSENTIEITIATTAVFIFIIWKKARNRKKALLAFEAHKQLLLDKYQDSNIVEMILNSEYWIGQTAEQLEDSLGAPTAVDTSRLKTKTKETWKYGEIRKGQFQLRINIENGKVVGWADKSA